MCGIFGILSPDLISSDFSQLAVHAEQRGRDASGLVIARGDFVEVLRADSTITKLLQDVQLRGSPFAMGHSRLVTNGFKDNQPIVRDGIIVIHNGIIVNCDDIWSQLRGNRTLEVDTEVIAAIVAESLEDGHPLSEAVQQVLGLCRGIVACAVAVPRLGKLALFSNNGSLYSGRKTLGIYFASEAHALKTLRCKLVKQIREPEIFDIPRLDGIQISDTNVGDYNPIPKLILRGREEKSLVYHQPRLRRCTRCILPETMPYIQFDEAGICNYCRNYKSRTKLKPKEELFDLVAPYRRSSGADCIVPFSGGRDSCYALHLVVTELNMRPIAYTYDWGMVTDLGRRNISRMCSELGVENIIIAADIQKKRRHIAANLRAWLRFPNLGMVSILTAGDKHFFRYIETVKRQTGIALNLWGTNPLEVTHFKSGFLGIPPDFEESKVYSSGFAKQWRYQRHRFLSMLKSPGYFNSSIWDTLSGEYFRSVAKRSDYYHIFDYWNWDETTVDRTLALYDWERAPDTTTTWRVGDGTAALYNYIYYTVAGFTEHDTFRSNQIREGQLSREDALSLVSEENRPRYPNIKWYLDTLSMDFSEVIRTINAIPRLYEMGEH